MGEGGGGRVSQVTIIGFVREVFAGFPRSVACRVLGCVCAHEWEVLGVYDCARCVPCDLATLHHIVSFDRGGWLFLPQR